MKLLVSVLTVAFLAHTSHCLSLGYNNYKDIISSEFVLLTPEQTQRLKYGARVEKREDEKENSENINNQGPKNVVLFFARFPGINNIAQAANLTEKTPVYLDFPVKSSVGSYYRPKNPNDQLLVVSPVALSENLPASAKRSCQAALDAGVAGLISWAERAKQMVTGFVSKPVSAPGNAPSPAATVKTAPVVKREIKKSDSGDSATEDVAGKSDASKDPGAALQTDASKDATASVASPPEGHVAGSLDEPGKPEVGVVTLEVVRNGEKREANIEQTGEPSPWDVFDMVNKMRRLWFESVLNVMGFDFSNSVEDDLHALSDPPGSPLAELLRTILRELQAEAGDKGFLLVVSGEDVDELQDAVQLVKDKTDPKDTLIVVTGQCPSEQNTVDVSKSNFWQFDPDNQLVFSTEQQRPTNQKRSEQLLQLPFYATGPKSDALANVKSLWGVPKAIQRLVKDRDRDNYKQKRSRPSSSNYMVKLPRNQFFVNNPNDNGKSPNSYFSNDRRPPLEDARPMARPSSKSRDRRDDDVEVQSGEPRSWGERHRYGDVSDEESPNVGGRYQDSDYRYEKSRDWGEQPRDRDIRDEKSPNWGEQPPNRDIRDEKSPNWGELPRDGDIRYEGPRNWGGRLHPQHVLERIATHDSDDEEVAMEKDAVDEYDAGRQDAWTEYEASREAGDKRKRETFGGERNAVPRVKVESGKRGAVEHDFWKQVIDVPPACDSVSNARRNLLQLNILLVCSVFSLVLAM